MIEFVRKKYVKPRVMQVDGSQISSFVRHLRRRVFKPREVDKKLFKAVSAGNLERMAELLEKGANPNARDKQGNTPLYHAGVKAVAGLLIEKGADVNAINKNYETPLHFASSKGIIRLLVSKGAYIDACNEDAETPLHYAASSFPSGAKIVQALLENGASMSRNVDCNTPLHLALDARIARVLLKNGADIDAENLRGETPLHVACYEGKKDVVKLLLQKGAQLDARDYDGHTPIDVAGKDIKRLLEKEMKKNSAD